MRHRTWLGALVGLSMLATVLPAPLATAAAPVQVVLDGKALSLNPAPVIQQDRTLVPLRGVFEAMGASLTWNGTDRTVTVKRGSRFVKLQIDRQLACLQADCSEAAMIDVPARLIGDRTFVPIRFLSTALGVRVSWDDQRRTVVIETEKPPVAEAAPVTFEGVSSGQTVRGPVALKVSGMAGSAFFYLVDPTTRTGHAVAAGADVEASYTFTPDPADQGPRLLIAAIRDEAGTLHYAQPVKVNVAPDTRVQVTGVEPGGLVDGPISFGHQVGFVATQVTYRLIDPASGSVSDLATLGPGDSFTWYPPVSQNGAKQIQVIALDRTGAEHSSAPVNMTVRTAYRTVFSSIKDGDVLNRPITLRTSGNYPIEGIKYVLDDRVLGWGFNFPWQFGPEMNGTHTLRVEVTGEDQVTRTLGPYTFSIDARPELWLSGVGPKQVVTDQVALKATSNVKLAQVNFYLKNPSTGQVTALGQRGLGEELAWKPSAGGEWTLFAEGADASGRQVATEPVTFKVYLGKIYSARPLMEKDRFKGFASELAVKTYQQTGMSAALQVAQSILETGWGQSLPVDKYTGQFSYNLFGIKGKGTAGSVISNTWEEYNGVAYRVDDYFRAYNSVAESWDDHHDLLLTKSWYAPFRAAMADPVLGAWGLRRSGYATDSQYPVKLINIMKTYDLFKLDEIAF